MSLKLEEIKFRNTESDTAFTLDFERECVTVFNEGRFAVEIPFQDIDAIQEQIDALQEQIDNNK